MDETRDNGVDPMGEIRDTGFDLMSETRDDELGRQLEAFGEPEHGPEYWRDVRKAVAEARAEAATAAAAETRRPGFGRRLRAAFAPRRARLALVAIAVAAVAAAALLVGLPGSEGPQPVSAAEVLRRALAVPGSVQTWQADVRLKFYFPNVWQEYHAYLTGRMHVTMSADGGAREEYSGYTAAGHRLVDPFTEVYLPGGESPPYYDDEKGSWVVEVNSPIGPPDAGGLPLIDMGLTVRALASSNVLRLGETTVEGRPAWTVTCTKGEMAGLPASDKDWPVYTVTVDKQTWFMLGVREEKAGRITSSISYSNIRVNEPLPDDVFTVEPPPPGAHVQTIDLGFHRVTLDKAASSPGVTPLVPGFVPVGYELSDAAVAARAKVMIGLEDGDAVFWGRHVFALRYERGFDWLAVSTRLMRERDYNVDTDLCEGFDQPWSKLARVEVPITSGAFAGVTARIVAASTSSPPHLWAMKDGVLLTIAGAATADELLAVAESLQPYPGASPSTD